MFVLLTCRRPPRATPTATRFPYTASCGPRFDRAGGVADADRQTARCEARQRTREGVAADAVIDYRHALAIGQFAHPRRDILVPVIDDVIAAVRAREFSLGGATGLAAHRRAELLPPLPFEQAHAAGGAPQQTKHNKRGTCRTNVGQHMYNLRAAH